MVDIAVILINYNNSSYTLQCIEAILHHTSEAITFEVIVVDNNSELPDFEVLEKKFPEDPRCSLHRSPVNTGFGGGNMFGVQFATADYLLFLNNDALLLNDCLGLLKKFMDEHPLVGLCTAQNYNEQNVPVPSFDHNKGMRRLLLGRGFLESVDPDRYPKRSARYRAPISVDWVNGAFLFFRSKAFFEIGGFDTRIFLYWEEMDLCHRLRQQGYKVMLVPDAKVLHYQGVSIGQSETINKESYRSYLYVIRKNFGLWKLLLVQIYLTVVFLLKPKKWYLLGTVLQGSSMKGSMRHEQKERHITD